MNDKPIRVLLAKTGLDPHDKGIRLVARGLKEMGGMEVFYTGLYRTLDEIVEAAVQERVEIVGLSIHTGSALDLLPSLRQALHSRGMGDVILIAGGVIPVEMSNGLREDGIIAEAFGPGSRTSDIIAWIQEAVSQKCDRNK